MILCYTADSDYLWILTTNQRTCGSDWKGKWVVKEMCESEGDYKGALPPRDSPPL